MQPTRVAGRIRLPGVITDESGRYALTQLNETVLWRYDRRWRSVSMHQPFGDMPFTSVEGKHHLAVISQPNPGGEIAVSIRAVAHPEIVLATGTFIDTWVFEGEPSLWALVPEYILISQKDGRTGLLRIADNAEIDILEGFDTPHAVAQVPNSRLVVLAGPASYTVYDAVAERSIRHFELAGGNQKPMLRFRNSEELWLNDVDTMLKVETKSFEVVDAAGSDVGEHTHVDTPTEKLGGFGRWTFAAENELCVVTRPNVGDVLVLDGVSMLPVARGIFNRGLPIEAMLMGRNTIIATDIQGRPLRTRSRRVTVNFETGE